MADSDSDIAWWKWLKIIGEVLILIAGGMSIGVAADKKASEYGVSPGSILSRLKF